MDSNKDDPKLLSERFKSAMNLAYDLHVNQNRKGTQIPYIAHLFGVAALVLEDGGSEDEAIAALLHDAVEDQGGIETLDKIRDCFGEQVASIVASLTDSYEEPKPDWRLRKENYIEHLKDAPPEVRRVSLADKLYNARSLLAKLQTEGDKTWLHFTGGKEGTLWYYKSLVLVFSKGGTDQMTKELVELVSKIDQLA
jgi:(p)ppGpp synthase/HD superfamily hydrolase